MTQVGKDQCLLKTASYSDFSIVSIYVTQVGEDQKSISKQNNSIYVNNDDSWKIIMRKLSDMTTWRKPVFVIVTKLVL